MQAGAKESLLMATAPVKSIFDVFSVSVVLKQVLDAILLFSLCDKYNLNQAYDTPIIHSTDNKRAE